MIDNEKLRKRAELVSRIDSEGEDGAVESLSPEELKTAFHELRVYRIELEMQNEELRKTQGELEVSESRFFDFYDLAPVGYCSVSEQGLILEANLTAARLLDITRGELTSQPFSRFILEEDQDVYYLYRKQLVGADQQQACELRMVRQGGRIFYARLVSVIATGNDGAPVCRIVLTDISDRKLAEEKINALLVEKELTLKEVHHRIKNNMRTMKIMLSLQAETMKDPAAVAALDDAGARMESMEILYDKLYRAIDVSELSIREYLPSLIDEIMANFPGNKSVKVIKNIEDIVVNARKLQSLGVIINELLTNIMKYAFVDRADGTIAVSVTLAKASVSVIVEDNGRGMPESVNFTDSTGFGLMLVQTLTAQLDGTIRIERGRGTKIVLEFKQ